MNCSHTNEILALEKFGNRLPQLTFEVFRRVSSTTGDSLKTIVRSSGDAGLPVTLLDRPTNPESE